SSFALFVVLATGTEVAGARGPAAPLRPLFLVLAAIPALLAVLAVAVPRVTSVRRGLLEVVAQLEREPRRARLVRAARRLVDSVRLVQPTAGAWVEAFGLA